MLHSLQRRTNDATSCAHGGDVLHSIQALLSPPYACGLAQAFAGAPLLVSNRQQSYNSRILAFVDVEAKLGKGSDVSSSSSP